jgi:hypothetical protein
MICGEKTTTQQAIDTELRKRQAPKLQGEKLAIKLLKKNHIPTDTAKGFNIKISAWPRGKHRSESRLEGLCALPVTTKWAVGSGTNGVKRGSSARFAVSQAVD